MTKRRIEQAAPRKSEFDTLSDSRVVLEWAWWVSMTIAGCVLLYLLPDPTPVFVNHRLTAIHLLAAIPIAYCLASWLQLQRRFALWLSIVAVLGIASFETTLPLLSDSMIPTTWGFASRWAIRTMLALAIAIPWILSCPVPHRTNTWREWLLAGILISVPSIVYASHQRHSLIQSSSQIDPRTSPKKLMLLTQQVMELDDTSSISGENCKRKLLQSMQTVDALERECKIPSDLSSDSAKLDRAVKLMAIDRLQDAWKLLEQTQPNNRSATFLKILCNREMEDWKRVREVCRFALQNPNGNSQLEQAKVYSWLADAFARERRFEQCIETYRTAIEQCPEQASSFRIDMALQLAESGQVPEALRILKEVEGATDATEISLRTAIKGQIRRIRNNSCTLPH